MPGSWLYLAGPAGSGKSAVANALEAYGFRRVSLGGLVRDEALRRGLIPTRAVLQVLGDEIRGDDPATLARLALAEAGMGDRLVVDGVRLVAEAELLRSAGFVGVLVRASGAVRAARLARRDGSPVVPPHVTEDEAALVPVNCVLPNEADNPMLLALQVAWLVVRIRSAAPVASVA